MNYYNLCFFKNKLAWKGKFVLFSFLMVFFTAKAGAGMVWHTEKAPIVDGLINQAVTYSYGALGRLVSIDFNDPTPNPCNNLVSTNESCFITFGVFHNYTQFPLEYVPSATAPTWSSTNYPDILKKKTMGELYTFLSQNGYYGKLQVGMESRGYGGVRNYCDPSVNPASGCIIKNRWEAYSKVCHALVYRKVSSSYYYVFPGQGCIGPTPPNNECNIDAGAVTLDHGQLGTDEVNGHRKRESFRISCTYPANAEVSVVSNNANEKIMLKGDGSLYSTITVDGVPGITGKKITIPTGGVPIDLESTLHTVGNIEEGPFSGNGILIINAY
ncbi:MrpH family fimbial adhesin [Serratia marcescens]|uniref:MrpH family fimbial adhesin n=1 Tax=Serratia marcescens TaxID=615 RepID=UPI0027E56C16|nr:hypothetical protein [Serratia marcescens]MDH2267788.1 hypothetical protein [Serratia marcescens]MDH2275765.1 hypothetical protein [Serratia marcescens]